MRNTIIRVFGKEYAPVLVLGLFFVVNILIFSILSPYFLEYDNILSIGANMAIIGLMAVVGTPVIIAGALDLSVAAIAGLAGVSVAFLYEMGVNIWLAVLMAIVLSGVLGLINGLLVTKFKLNPLIVTLGSMSIITGFSLVFTNGLTKPLIIENFNWVGAGYIFNIPVPLFIMIFFTVLLWWIMVKTKFGREVYAAGGNPVASNLMGISVSTIQIKLYILSGAIGGLAGIVLSAMLGASAPNAVGNHLLTVVAAIILGGTSLHGGRGSIWGTFIAVMLLGALNNGLTLMNVSSFWQDIARGFVLIIAVILDQIRLNYTK